MFASLIRFMYTSYFDTINYIFKKMNTVGLDEYFALALNKMYQISDFSHDLLDEFFALTTC